MLGLASRGCVDLGEVGVPSPWERMRKGRQVGWGAGPGQLYRTQLFITEFMGASFPTCHALLLFKFL